MKTNYQFLLVSSPPAKEHAFQKAKSSHGSTYAFQLAINQLFVLCSVKCTLLVAPPLRTGTPL